MRELGEGSMAVLNSHRTRFGGHYIEEVHDLNKCSCSYCCKVVNHPQRGAGQLWAPALKYWLAGWWTYVRTFPNGQVLYFRYTLPQWVRPSRWW
jgi:hypothetical protein